MTRPSVLAVGVLGASLLAGACSGRASIAGTASSGAVRAKDCSTCHAAIAAEWRGSLHRAAFTDATFQASLALEAPADRSFCTRCHAPASDPAAGVDCRACHEEPHSARAAVASRPATCAPCHEFAFDGRAELVQKTLSEHAASSFAGVGCADCHMPDVAGHRSHAFLAGHAPAVIARAVHASATRAGPRAIDLDVQVDAGHAFPTGDMFRRARLVVFAESIDGRIVGDAERIFGRTWRGVPGSGGRSEETDTRIRGRWRDRITFEDPPAPIAKVRWSLLYERVLAVRGPHVTIASTDPVATGELAFAGAPAR